MKQITLNYAKPFTGKLGAEVCGREVIYFPIKEFYQRTILLAFAFVLFSPFAFAQNGTVTGTVSGADGVMQAATITAGKTSVLTDNDGRFSLSLNPGNYTLVITHTGYKEVMQEMTIENGNTKTIEVSLIPSGDLGEVVVLGSRSLVQRSNLNTACRFNASKQPCLCKVAGK